MRLHPRHTLLAAACVLALAGCQTASVDFPNPFKQAGVPVDTNAPETTGSIGATGAVDTPVDGMPPKKALLGADQYDDLSQGKRAYAAGNYGLAETYFRRAAELSVNDAEAWLGLAASYDRLRRFDLADRAYKNLIRLTGPTAEVLNNIGYSYILRGDYGNARMKLAEALAKDPQNPYVRANIDVLEQATAKRKGVR
jgi:Flp pilus assembly protein TadD